MRAETGSRRAASRRPIVAVVTTGGTIASLPAPDGGVVAAVPGRVLVEPLGAGDVRVELHELMCRGSYGLAVDDLLAIALTVRRLARRPGVDGVVVTHGTDTLEETAWLADLLHGGDEPVVFTGAQRHGGSTAPDGPRNLADAIRVAASPAARGLGTMVALGGRIDHARDATKLHTSAEQPFATPGVEPLGHVGSAGVDLQRTPPRRPRFAAQTTIEPRVELVKLAAGCDGTLVDACVASGAQGLVLECFGVGNANAAVVAAVRRATAAGVAVIVVSRCPGGAVAPRYLDGGGRDLADAGAVFGGDLSGPKARILLMVSLTAAARGDGTLDELIAPHARTGRRSAQRGADPRASCGEAPSVAQAVTPAASGAASAGLQSSASPSQRSP